MQRLFRLVVFVPLIVLLIGVADVSDVYACSGGVNLSVAGLIDNYVIKAHALEIDDREQNAIIEVEEYLVGGPGPRYMLISQNSPLVYESLREGLSGGGDCAGIGVRIPDDGSFYVFPRRDYDGSYNIGQGLFNDWLYDFPSPGSTVEIYPVGGAVINDNEPNEFIAEPGSGVDVTEEEFLSIIAEVSGETPAAPLANTPYPRFAPLRITTENTDYLLPVDNNLPIEITDEIWRRLSWIYPRHNDFPRDENCQWYEPCAQLSPNRMSLGMQIDENTIELSWNDTFEGQAFLFSPSDAVAIWNANQLEIYTLGYPRLGQIRHQIALLNTLELNTPTNEMIGRGAWIPDGRLLAYSDLDGLWLWDVYTLNSEPRLLIPPNEGNTTVSLPRHFSPMGRYLAIETDDLRQNYDIISSEYYPDGLISPDDRVLLTLDTGEIPSPEFGICILTNFNCDFYFTLYASTLYENGEVEQVYGVDQIYQAEWLSRFEVFLAGCDSDNPEICGVYRISSYNAGWYAYLIDYGTMFDFDYTNDILAILTNNTTIQIGNNEIDLSNQVDGDIVGIEWMPSLFYYR